MAIFKIGKLVMQSLFKKPATLMYPVIKREYPDQIRGQLGIDIDTCILCSICARKCPTNAITVDRKTRIWEIERMRCIQCSCCVHACPKKCLFMEANKGYTDPDFKPVSYKVEKPEEEPKPAADKPAGDKPAAAPKADKAQKPAADKPAAPAKAADGEGPASKAGKPAADKPAADKPVADKAADKAATVE